MDFRLITLGQCEQDHDPDVRLTHIGRAKGNVC
jgi:hypothetical protein